MSSNIHSTESHEDLDFRQSVSTSVSSPFLRLPVDLRLLIYRHLIPNVLVPTVWNDPSHPPLRDNGGPCCPALLRTNRMIYHEMLEEWYSSVQYAASLQYQGIRFLNKIIPPSEPLPSAFRLIKSLVLGIDLRNRPKPGQDGSAQQHFFDRVAEVAECFSREESRKLQELKIHLHTSLPFFGRVKGQPDELRKSLDFNLHSLRAIRGLHKVRIEITVATRVIGRVQFGSETDESFLKLRDEYLAVAQEFLGEMEREMSTPHETA